ncbi:MAG: septum formation protein Maf [Alcanivoracaceae bacterium]|nr:septum formation protein Maf [Alcanivoracaceae bacterium]
MQIVLASSSKYRKKLFQRLNIKFSCYSPDINEGLNHGLTLEDNVQEIAKKKAQAVSVLFPEALIIASDQLCAIDDIVMGKPMSFENAFKQLKQASGKDIIFYTGLVVFNPQSNQYYNYCDQTTVVFRNLTDQEIEHYLVYEQPYDCAGSFKVESLGVSLFDKIINQDPTALIGLPLIKLCHILRKNGVLL